MGLHLARKILDNYDDIELYLVDNYERGIKDSEYESLGTDSKTRIIEIDLNYENLNPLPRDFDYVFHFAAINGTQNFYLDPLKTLTASSIPTLNLLQYLDLKKIKNFVFASTSELYAGGVDASLNGIPTSEEIVFYLSDLDNLRWSYAIGKLYSEQLVKYSGIKRGLKYTILRLHNIYGDRMGDNHVIPDLFSKFQTNNFEVHGVDQTRTFCHIDDALSQIQNLTFKNEGTNEIFNIGVEDEIRIKDLAQMILDILEIDASITELSPFKGSVNRRVPNMSKLKAHNHYENSVSLNSGLKQYYSWLKNQ